MNARLTGVRLGRGQQVDELQQLLDAVLGRDAAPDGLGLGLLDDLAALDLSTHTGSTRCTPAP